MWMNLFVLGSKRVKVSSHHCFVFCLFVVVVFFVQFFFSALLHSTISSPNETLSWDLPGECHASAFALRSNYVHVDPSPNNGIFLPAICFPSAHNGKLWTCRSSYSLQGKELSVLVLTYAGYLAVGRFTRSSYPLQKSTTLRIRWSVDWPCVGFTWKGH